MRHRGGLTKMQINWIEFSPRRTFINIKTTENQRYTYQVPGFGEKLLKVLPGLKYHKCYNPRNLTFVEELKDTSIAHVFEHILLEIVGQKMTMGQKLKAFTSWNWLKEPRGHYKIKLHTGEKDLVLESLNKAFEILELCLGSHELN